jgi:Virulence activator alpha C-term
MSTILKELKADQVLHQERLAIDQQIQQNAFAKPEQLPEQELFRYLTLCGGIQYERGWLNWCEKAIAILAKHSASSVSSP